MNTPHSFKEILPHDKLLFSGISLLEAIQLADTPVDDLKKANGATAHSTVTDIIHS